MVGGCVFIRIRYRLQRHSAVYRYFGEELRALQDTLYFIDGRWRLPVLNSICNGSKRFREIERSVPGITTRMLSKELKDMEMNKLVKRTVYADSPVTVEYEPTEYRHSFGTIIQSMIDWSRAHRNVVTKRGSLATKAPEIKPLADHYASNH